MPLTASRCPAAVAICSGVCPSSSRQLRLMVSSGRQVTLALKESQVALLGASGVWRPAHNKWRHSLAWQNRAQDGLSTAAVRSAVCQQELDHLGGAGLCCNMKQRGCVLGVRVQLEQVRSHCEELSNHSPVSRLAGRNHRRRNEIWVAAPSSTPLRTSFRQRRWRFRFHSFSNGGTERGMLCLLPHWMFGCRAVGGTADNRKIRPEVASVVR